MYRRINSGTTALICSLVVVVPNASAETSPYYVGTSLGLTHVSNIYRLDAAQPTNNDWVTTGSVLAGIDQRFGRQRAWGNLSLRSNRYRSNTNLNNTAYQFDSGLDWAAFDKLTGTLGVSASESLADFNPGGDRPSLTIKNVQTNRQANASVRYGLAGKLSIEAKANHYASHYSVVQYLPYEVRQNEGALGLSYRPSSALQLGSYARLTHVTFPNYRLTQSGFVADRIHRKDLDLTASWFSSPISSVSARLSLSRADHSDASTSSFSGTTGSLAWQWQPAAKWSLTTTLTRDAGLDSTPGTAATLGNQLDYNRITNRVQLEANYAATAKLSGYATYLLAKRNITNSAGTNSISGDDTLTSWRLGMNWSATRNASLNCAYTHDQRVLGQAQPISPYTLPFSANSLGCTGQYMLR